MADDLGREAIPGVAGASRCPHPTRLLVPICRRKRRPRQVDGAVRHAQRTERRRVDLFPRRYACERVRRPVVRRVQGRDGWRCIQNPVRRANAADGGIAASDTISALYMKYRTRIAYYSAAIRSQVISRCSSLSPVRRGGGMRTIRSPSKRTPRTCSLPIRLASEAASTRVTSFAPSKV